MGFHGADYTGSGGVSIDRVAPGGSSTTTPGGVVSSGGRPTVGAVAVGVHHWSREVAQRGLGASAVRHSSQTLLDGGPKLTLGGPLPGDGLARLGGSLSHIPGRAGRWDGLNPGRRAGLPRGLPDLWLQTPRPAARIFGFHELWHHFVLASSACQFWVMLRYIAPLS
jgi:hypothetical protein